MATETQDGEPPAMDAADWRTLFNPEYRQQFVNTLIDKLKKHMVWYGLEEGLLSDDLKEVCEKYEERIYNEATSESDYISNPMLNWVFLESPAKSLLDMLLSIVVELAVVCGETEKRVLEFHHDRCELGNLKAFWAGVRDCRDMTIAKNPGLNINFDFLPPGFDDEDDDEDDDL